MTRIYTPDGTGRCTVCGRPEAEHARSGGWVGDEARCMPVPSPVEAALRAEEAMQEAAERYTRALDAFRSGDSSDTTALSSAARDLDAAARAFVGAA